MSLFAATRERCPERLTVTGETDAVLVATHVLVVRALELAGKRMVTGDRRHRPELRTLQLAHPWRLHTLVDVQHTELDRLLDGAWSLLEELLPDRHELVPVLDGYCRALLLGGAPHSVDNLRRALAPVTG